MPTTPLAPGKATVDVMTGMHKSDVTNARAVNQCKARDKKLKSLYKATQ